MSLDLIRLGATSWRRPAGSPAGNEDTFDVDSTAQYTQFADSQATWFISGGQLFGTGGNFPAQSVFIRNGVSLQDTAVEADVAQSYDAGLVLRFQDNLNYYLLIFNDDSGITPSLNMRMWRRANGTFIQLGGDANFSWPRGAPANVRFQVVGNQLSAYFNGLLKISAVDSGITSAGGVGPRHNGSSNSSIYDAFRWGLTPI